MKEIKGNIVIFVRHGKTADNAAGMLSGSDQDTQLNNDGIIHASTMAAKLREGLLPSYVRGNMADVNFVASGLIRSRQTIEIIQKELGASTRIVVNKNARERSYGSFTDTPSAEFFSRWYHQRMRELSEEPPVSVYDSRIRDEETYGEMTDRALALATDIYDSQEDGNVTVVGSHGAFMHAMLLLTAKATEYSLDARDINNMAQLVYCISEKPSIVSDEDGNMFLQGVEFVEARDWLKPGAGAVLLDDGFQSD